jgi:hypothetical protein
MHHIFWVGFRRNGAGRAYDRWIVSPLSWWGGILGQEPTIDPELLFASIGACGFQAVFFARFCRESWVATEQPRGQHESQLASE